MIRRVNRTPAALSKSVSKVTVLGGSQPMTAMCLGYIPGADGLKLCPANAMNAISGLTSDNLCSIDSYPENTILLYADGSVCSISNGAYQEDIFGVLPEGNPFSMLVSEQDGTPYLVVACANKISKRNLKTGASVTNAIPLSIYGGVMHCGRLFAVDSVYSCKVVWSGLDMLDWDDKVVGGGYIYLNNQLGDVHRLENLGDDILCVREYGFTVIKGLADSRNFRISPSQESIKTTKINKHGGVLGQKYYFSTANGLHSFDGEQVKSEYAVDACLSEVGGVYVLNDGYVYADCVYCGYSCIMRYDVQSGTAVFFGMGCRHPFMVAGELYCLNGNKFYKMSEKNTGRLRIWRSLPISGHGVKTLKNLYVDSDKAISINVVGGGLLRKLSGTGKISVNLKGENMSLVVYGDVPVRSISVELEERR